MLLSSHVKKLENHRLHQRTAHCDDARTLRSCQINIHVHCCHKKLGTPDCLANLISSYVEGFEPSLKSNNFFLPKGPVPSQQKEWRDGWFDLMANYERKCVQKMLITRDCSKLCCRPLALLCFCTDFSDTICNNLAQWLGRKEGGYEKNQVHIGLRFVARQRDSSDSKALMHYS